MSYFKDKLPKEYEFNALLDACINQLQAVRYSPKVSAVERNKALMQVQATFPNLRRCMVYFMTKEQEAEKK